jgi:hypothetical protein
MLKRFSVSLIALFGFIVWAHAQDAGLPALPPLPGQEVSPATSSATALPPLPGETSSSVAPSNDLPLPALPEQNNSAVAQPALPTLPGSSDASSSLVVDKKAQKIAAKEEKRKANELKKLNKTRKKQGLEPLAELPKESGSPAPAVAPVAASASPELPALPSAEVKATVPVEAAANTSTAEEKPKVKSAKKTIQKWHAPDFGPNVILGGLVRTKGGTTEEKLAWVSQFVLNGMDFHGYEVQKEEGVYAGQLDKNEWRKFTFLSRKKKAFAPVVIYVEPAQGNSVWLRVGPSEPPAGVPAKEVRKIRLQNQQVLAIMKKQLKGALRPVSGRWELPFHRTNG